MFQLHRPRLFVEPSFGSFRVRRWMPCALLLVALGCGWITLHLLAADRAWLAVITALLALLSMLYAFRLVPASATSRTIGDRAAPVPTPRQRNAGLRALILAATLAIGTAIHLERTPYIDWTLLLYPLALLLAWCGEGWLSGLTVRRRMRGIGNSIIQRRGELLLLAVLTGLGLLFRVWMLLQYPFLHGTMADEVDTAISAWNLAHSTGPWPIYQLSTPSVPFFQPIALSFDLLGTSLLAVRIPELLESTLLIPAFYVLARQFVAFWPALSATCLLTFAYWPAMLSLWAFGWMNGAVFQALGLGLLAYAIRRGSYSIAAASGAILALCLYCYVVSRVLPMAGAVFLLPMLLRGTRPLKDRFLLCASVGLGFAVVVAPFVGSVLSTPGLLGGDSSVNTQDFTAAAHHDLPAALAGLVQPAARLLETVLAVPRLYGGHVSIRVWHGGLLDTVTAILVLLGLLYAAAYCWRSRNLLILSTLVVVFGLAATVQVYWQDGYRLGCAVPALFLAAAVVLDRGLIVVSQAAGSGRRWGLVLLATMCVVSTGTNVHQMTMQLTDCTAMAYPYQALSNDDEGVLMADKVNALGPARATFVVSRYFQLWLYVWLYHVSPPIEYNAQSGPADDPGSWRVMWSSTVPISNAPGAAHFWPPAVGRGQTAVTYIMPDGDSGFLLPILQRVYPQGTLEMWQNSVCPAFKITTYSLSAQQIAQGPKG